jgi:putative nucleotidyltransferase with HDIG domain
MRSGHLARRFFGSLRPGRPHPDDLRWAHDVLGDDDLFALWARQPGSDQRHSLAVARGVERMLAGTAEAGDRRWPTCALLHDIGKLDARLGVYGRVVATLAGAVAGHEMAGPWSQRRGFTRRVGLYLRHPELGAVSVRLAGGPEEAARWAAAHHDDPRPGDLGIPPVVVEALIAWDDD